MAMKSHILVLIYFIFCIRKKDRFDWECKDENVSLSGYNLMPEDTKF
ncbi:hypothetical protein IX324_000257 [Bacteroides pyogenes]|nr:hypothetical protein [Bacteroides pyogenes]